MKLLQIITLSIVLLTLSACGSKEESPVYDTTVSDGTQETQEGVEVPADVVVESDEEEPAPPEREIIMAPEFTLMDSKGEPISLSDYQGKIVFVNFWTTWCKYCLEEMPDFQDAYEKYGDDLEILLVNVTTDENISNDEIIAWYEAFNLTMPMVLDVDGEVIANYPVQGYPTTYFIDRDGSLIAYYPGAMTPDIIDQVMAEFK